MERKKPRSFRDSIRDTLFLYALVPVLAVVTAVYLTIGIAVYYWIWHQSAGYAREAAQLLETAIETTGETLEALAVRPELASGLQERRLSREVYEELYAVINGGELKGNFYLLDREFRCFSGSSTIQPDYFRDGMTHSQRTRRDLETQEGISRGWETFGAGGQPSYSMAVPVRSGKGTAGYLLVDFRQSEFLSLVDDSATDVMVANSMRHVYWDTGAGLTDGQGKLFSRVGSSSRFLLEEKRLVRCEVAPACGGELLICAVRDVTEIFFAMAAVGVVSFLILAGMLVLNGRVSGILAKNKTRIIDQISETMSQAKEAGLRTPMIINSGDEFEKISAAYNSLCEEIGRLIEDNKESTRQQMLAEVRRLESQFNPHFIFNTLETIKVLIYMDPASAQKAITKLAELLRYSIDDTFGRVTLAEDIHYTECYLYIQKLRFQNKLHYSIEQEAGTEGLLVPRLIIQPLVENAIKYGKDEEGVCTVQIEIRREDEALVVQVEDRGVPITEEKLAEINGLIGQERNTSAHVGLYNIQRRVRLSCGEAYGLTAERRQEGGARFQLRLPGEKGNE